MGVSVVHHFYGHSCLFFVQFRRYIDHGRTSLWRRQRFFSPKSMLSSTCQLASIATAYCKWWAHESGTGSCFYAHCAVATRKKLDPLCENASRLLQKQRLIAQSPAKCMWENHSNKVSWWNSKLWVNTADVWHAAFMLPADLYFLRFFCEKTCHTICKALASKVG